MKIIHQQQLKTPSSEVIETNSDHLLLTIKRTWKGKNAENEVTHRVKLFKKFSGK